MDGGTAAEPPKRGIPKAHILRFLVLVLLVGGGFALARWGPLAEYLDMSLGDLLEGICLHAFDGKSPFSPATLKTIGQLKAVYGLDLDASASHRLREADD